MRPNSCQKAPLRNVNGEIISKCLVCAGPVKLTPDKKEKAMNDNKTKPAEAKEILDILSLDVDTPPPADKVELNLPKAQMCACGRDWAEPLIDGRKGQCKLCKKRTFPRGYGP